MLSIDHNVFLFFYFKVYSLGPTIEFVLSLTFYDRIQIYGNDSSHIY